jgi:stage V sporulation protein D (sporulation-specific penicillin-binding protein)
MQSGRCKQIGWRGSRWAVVTLLLMAALAVKLFIVQVVLHQEYVAKAQRTRGRTWPINAPRGNIYDRNGNPLALNLKLYSVAADPSLIDDPAATAKRLAPLLKMPEDELKAKLSQGGQYVRLREAVDEQVADAVRELNDKGIVASTEWKRAYPHEQAAAALLGFVRKDMYGLGGIEAALNSRLAGTDGQMLVVLDGRLPRSRNEVPGRTLVVKDMKPGSSVALTIDLTIQAIAEEALAKAVEKANAAGGTAVVMDPDTGEILALASQPGFDPNEFGRYDKTSLVSHAVVSPYEPGSTFKVITAAAAMEEGVFSRGETYTCTGSRPVGKKKVSCALHAGSRAHGTLDLDHMIIKSCNVGMATVGMALGADRLYKWASRLGFGKKTGIELASESSGLLFKPQTWSLMQTANVGFGQGVSVTALQLVSAYCAVANGGKLVHPHMLKVIVDPGGKVELPKAAAPERILSKPTCDRLKADLEKVVLEGTGKAARIPHRRVAGKTGTAQKPTPGAGYNSGKYIGSFVGFAPVDNPRVAVLVAIDEPRGAHYGGVVAAPAFSEICERTLAYMRVPPDSIAPDSQIASVSGAAE